MKLEDIRKLLRDQEYDQYVVTDLASFRHCLPQISREKLTAKGIEAEKRFNAFAEKSRFNAAKVIPPLMITPETGSNVIKGVVKKMEAAKKKGEQQAECSNFAAHSIGVLLEAGVHHDYNICLVGIMRDSKNVPRHNMTILVPKGVLFSDADRKIGKLPEGTLIVDPWAVGLGYGSDVALAVSKDNYIYKDSIGEIEFRYESNNDMTLYPDVVQVTPMPVGRDSEVADYFKTFDGELDDLKKQMIGESSTANYDKLVNDYNLLVDFRNDFVNGEQGAADISGFEESISEPLERIMNCFNVNYDIFCELIPVPDSS